jgi:hypothetical protein
MILEIVLTSTGPSKPPWKQTCFRIFILGIFPISKMGPALGDVCHVSNLEKPWKPNLFLLFRNYAILFRHAKLGIAIIQRLKFFRHLLCASAWFKVPYPRDKPPPHGKYKGQKTRSKEDPGKPGWYLHAPPPAYRVHKVKSWNQGAKKNLSSSRKRIFFWQHVQNGYATCKLDDGRPENVEEDSCSGVC